LATRRRDIFTTIRTEGGLLPADLLQRIASGDRDLEGLTPESYHLAPGEKINEVVNRAWNRLLGAWESFRAAVEKLPTGDPGTSVTRERWLLPLFQELGYGRLQTARAVEIEGKTYAVSHAWGHAPIHLVGCLVDLDRPTRGVAGAARASPHSLVQELLNRADDYLWAFLSNGRRLRILRDNRSLTRQSFVEFDLNAMMEGEVYADFALLWLLCHQSRVEAERPELCWLERWSQAAQEQGTRALDQLRVGVEQAITALGSGFLTHPVNRALRENLRSGALSTQEYYRQLLRVVYRLLFLFVAEDRELLLDPNAAQEARDRYLRFYAASRLRRLAERQRGTRHSDLYHGLRLVLDHLHAGCPALGLPALGSFLFAPEATPDLNASDIANHDLLKAVRALAFTLDNNIRRPVDYKNLRSEELGSVYEALLELHPELNVDAGTFALRTAGGSERKTTGSYYTPDSLVQCLLDTALDPVLEEAVKGSGFKGSRGLGKEDEHGRDQIVSRPSGVATGNATGEGLVSADERVSESRTLRDDESDTPGGNVYSSKYRGRERPGQPEGLSTVSADSAGQSPRVGDLSDSLPGDRIGDTSANSALDDSAGIGQQTPSSPHPFSGTQNPTTLTPQNPTTPEQRLLSLKICDPACGSGHFLIAAAHRMAKRLASVRTGDEEPSPEATRTALRDIIGRCIYGVDINPMAVELCKVALWMEALEPGKPLSFLDHHIQCGNSLLGTTPELLDGGIPDSAFIPIEGDDKEVCAEFKRKNRQEREGQGALFDANLQPWERLGDLPQAVARLHQTADDTLAGVQERERLYAELVRSQPYENSRLLADAWCAAFVWKKTREGGRYPLTTAHLRRILHNPYQLEHWMREEIRRLAQQYRFFHWHLAFPEVFGVSGEWGVGSSDSPLPTAYSRLPHSGFDAMLGNPPWERVKLQEKEWFAVRNPEIANAANAAKRQAMIRALKTEDPALYDAFLEDRRQAEGESQLLRQSGRYPLCGRGDVNTYAVFAELFRSLLSPTGRAGVIVPTGIATDDTTKAFFADLTDTQTLGGLYDFENRKGLFPAVDSRMKFCVLTMNGARRPAEKGAEFVFFAHSTEDLRDPERRFTLSTADIALLNPNTKTCPVFRSRRDAEITKGIYRRVPVLINEAEHVNPWGIEFMRMLDMANDSGLFHSEPAAGYLPLYEAKMIHHFNHRWATYGADGDIRDTTLAERADPRFTVTPRYWVDADEVEERLKKRDRAGNITWEWKRGWLLGWRDICRSTDERTVIASLLPRVGVGHTCPLMFPANDSALAAACLLANLSSFIFDYAARQKVGGTHLKYHVFKQLPVLPPEAYLGSSEVVSSEVASSEIASREIVSSEIANSNPTLPPYSLPRSFATSLVAWIAPRVLELSYTAWDMMPFGRDCGFDGDPFVWNEDRRFLLRCELDALYFHLYGIERDDVDYILETFPIVKRKDEAEHGEYRTKRVILEIYDDLKQAMETGVPYPTRLDPPPAHGWTPPEELLKEAFASQTTCVVPANRTPDVVREEPEEFELTPPPAPDPALDIDPGRAANNLSARVRVNGRLGVLLAETPSGDGKTLVMVQFDGETKPRKFLSPPAVVERIGAEAQ